MRLPYDEVNLFILGVFDAVEGDAHQIRQNALLLSLLNLGVIYEYLLNGFKVYHNVEIEDFIVRLLKELETR